MRDSVMDCASPLPLWQTHALESARGLAQSKTWRQLGASVPWRVPTKFRIPTWSLLTSAATRFIGCAFRATSRRRYMVMDFKRVIDDAG